MVLAACCCRCVLLLPWSARNAGTNVGYCFSHCAPTDLGHPWTAYEWGKVPPHLPSKVPMGNVSFPVLVSFGTPSAWRPSVLAVIEMWSACHFVLRLSCFAFSLSCAAPSSVVSLVSPLQSCRIDNADADRTPKAECGKVSVPIYQTPSHVGCVKRRTVDRLPKTRTHSIHIHPHSTSSCLRSPPLLLTSVFLPFAFALSFDLSAEENMSIPLHCLGPSTLAPFASPCWHLSRPWWCACVGRQC